MDIIDVENKCKEISELRKRRYALQQDINKLVSQVTEFMKKDNKNRLKVGTYSIELAKRIRRDFDFKFLDELQEKGLLPESKMKKSHYERLLITSAQTLKLVGNKFVRVDEEEV
jgi:1,2-phenylacetyl-CoA epoxidase catalytic subunit